MKVASRAEIDRDWSADDVIAAHAMLDAMEEAQARALAETRRQAQPSR
jgi:hypothetical protein